VALPGVSGAGTRYIRRMYVEFDGRHPWAVFHVECPADTGLVLDLAIDDTGPMFVVRDAWGRAEGARLPPVTPVGEWVRIAATKHYFMSRIVVLHGGEPVMTLERRVRILEPTAVRLIRWLRRPRSRSEVIEP
jgi:hypothetical protein